MSQLKVSNSVTKLHTSTAHLPCFGNPLPLSYMAAHAEPTSFSLSFVSFSLLFFALNEILPRSCYITIPVLLLTYHSVSLSLAETKQAQRCYWLTQNSLALLLVHTKYVCSSIGQKMLGGFTSVGMNKDNDRMCGLKRYIF